MVPRQQAAVQQVAPEAAPPDRDPVRLGPRPLALHLGMAALTWMSSQAALPSLSDGSLPWSPRLGKKAAALRASLARADPEAFAQAVAQQALGRQHALLDGIAAYRAHPYRRRVAEPPEVWRAGTTRLLDFGAEAATADAIPLLVVPSLINRSYVLDLSPRHSLLRWLAGRGFRPFLVDWGRPGPEERGFGLTDYIANRLDAALERSLALSGRPPVLLGYCMGGLLALALAQRRQADLAGVALLATPWDFHAADSAQSRLAATALDLFAPMLEALGELPVDAIQALFAALDPQLVPRKFTGFAALDPTGPQAEAFVALEDWLNDGVPLAAPVARECLLGWYGANETARGRWRVAGTPVEPTALGLPTLCVIPARDRIVPPASAVALAVAIPDAERLTPAAGHIGMVVSARAKSRVWQPLAEWMRARVA